MRCPIHQARCRWWLVLLTNDHGFFAEGIRALSLRIKKLAKIFIVAPDREKSATSLAIILRRPLRVEKIKANVYAVDGTPADCVSLAVKKFLPRNPDLLISGINHDPNLGQQDLAYSGRASPAIQAVSRGFVSVTPLHRDLIDYRTLRSLRLPDLLLKIKHEIS